MTTTCLLDDDDDDDDDDDSPRNVVHDGGDDGHVPLLNVAPSVRAAEDQLGCGEKLAQIGHKGQDSTP